MNNRLLPLLAAGAFGLAIGVWVSIRAFSGRLAELEHRHPLQGPVHAHPDSGYSAWLPGFERLAEASLPSVVTLVTKSRGMGGVWSEIFSLPQQGTGSGVVLDERGHIVTNYHVVEGVDEIVVKTHEGREHRARLVAADAATDLAVVQVDSLGLKPIAFADSRRCRVGEWIMSIGNPFNLNNTVTVGIISAKARNIQVLSNKNNVRNNRDVSVEAFLQTDAVINPGNSGGALLNLQGKLIGINSAIATDNGSFQGYSFAIPSNLVRKVVNDLIAHGEVRRGYLGILVQESQPASGHNQPGVVLADAPAGGAAHAAGLRSGDRIVAFNGAPVATLGQLQEELATLSPGQTTTLAFVRGSRRQTVRVTLKAKPSPGNTEAVLEGEEDALGQGDPEEDEGQFEEDGPEAL